MFYLENKLEKKYGLFMAICMVIGIVIGSGIFFKAQDILVDTGGNMLIGVLAFLIGGIVMIVCALTFANFASKYEKVNGIVDYAEAIVGKKYAYFVGWFVSIIYFPAMTSVLAWVSARYTLVLFGSSNITGGLCLALACMYLVMAYALNVLSPKLAGKFHVSSTIIKLIPISIMIVVGSIVGLINGNTANAFSEVTSNGSIGFDSIFSAIVAASFAYEGWIIATTINSELKDSKKNLPKALVIGTLVIIVVYTLYFISLTGGANTETLMNKGATTAFTNLFGNIGGTILNAFIVVSCWGTLNGLMLGCTRGVYSVAVRGLGPKPKTLANVDEYTNMPTNAGVVAILVCACWLFYFTGANLVENPIFGVFSFDSSELPIVTTYAIYLPIFIMFIIKEGKKDKLKNMILPIVGCICCLFMVFAAIYAHGVVPYLAAKENGTFSFPILFYLILFAVVMGIGALFNLKKKGIEKEKDN